MILSSFFNPVGHERNQLILHLLKKVLAKLLLRNFILNSDNIFLTGMARGNYGDLPKLGIDGRRRLTISGPFTCLFDGLQNGYCISGRRNLAGHRRSSLLDLRVNVESTQHPTLPLFYPAGILGTPLHSLRMLHVLPRFATDRWQRNLKETTCYSLNLSHSREMTLNPSLSEVDLLVVY